MDEHPDLDVLRSAFPERTCAWCGKARRPQHALCPHCWLHRMNRHERLAYMDMPIVERARWIVVNVHRGRAP